MSISPHTSEALIHRHVLLRNLLRRTLAVVLAGHGVDRIYEKEGRSLQCSTRAEKCRETGTVANADVLEDGTLGQYLKTRSEEADASGRTKGNHN